MQEAATTVASRFMIGRDPPKYEWIALSNITLGLTMATVNASILLIPLPAIFRGIDLDPLDPANVSYLLWMLMGFLLVTAVVVVTFGRLGDIHGRVSIYNLGFIIFALSLIALSLVPWDGSAGALWAYRSLHEVGARHRGRLEIPATSPSPWVWACSSAASPMGFSPMAATRWAGPIRGWLPCSAAASPFSLPS